MHTEKVYIKCLSRLKGNEAVSSTFSNVVSLVLLEAGKLWKTNFSFTNTKKNNNNSKIIDK